MTRGEYVFIIACVLVVFAMVGSVNLVAGAFVSMFVGASMWFLLATLTDIGEQQK